MKKNVLSCVAVLSLGFALPAMADMDETFMDWSYASGLEPKQRPQVQEKMVAEEGVNEEVASDSFGRTNYDAGVYATSEMGGLTLGQNTATTSQYTNATYTMTQNAAAYGANAGVGYGTGMSTMGVGSQNASGNAYTVNTQSGQVSAAPQYYQVPMNAIQTPAEIHHINNPIKVQYPVTKQYPISMQYPVTVQKEITVQRPVVVQQPIVVQRPIVMQQPVMVQHQPLMVQNKPVMVQQQPTVVQKQPIVVNAPAPMVTPTAGCPFSGGQMGAVQTGMMPAAVAPVQQSVVMPKGVAGQQMIQVPVQVSGTFTGVATPTASCTGGCAGY